MHRAGKPPATVALILPLDFGLGKIQPLARAHSIPVLHVTLRVVCAQEGGLESSSPFPQQGQQQITETRANAVLHPLPQIRGGGWRGNMKCFSKPKYNSNSHHLEIG